MCIVYFISFFNKIVSWRSLTPSTVILFCINKKDFWNNEKIVADTQYETRMPRLHICVNYDLWWCMVWCVNGVQTTETLTQTYSDLACVVAAFSWYRKTPHVVSLSQKFGENYSIIHRLILRKMGHGWHSFRTNYWICRYYVNLRCHIFCGTLTRTLFLFLLTKWN